MESIDAVLAFVSGFILRFGIPLAITAFCVWLLRTMDRRWQKDAEAKGLVEVRAKNPGCWNQANCTPERRAKCMAYQHKEMPCWQVFRDQNGRLRDSCLTCNIFLEAPMTASP